MIVHCNLATHINFVFSLAILLSLSLFLVVSKVQIDVRESKVFVNLFAVVVVVVLSVCFFVVDATDIISESEDELAVEQGHRESIVPGFLLNAAFGLEHNSFTSGYFNI